jgi:LysM repeat protein
MAATYRRRRLAVLAVVVVVGVLAVLGALTVVHAAQGLVTPAAPAASAASAASHTVVVQAGDTLWTIAAALPHKGDLRALVDRLAALNGGSQIHAGPRLVVPGR